MLDGGVLRGAFGLVGDEQVGATAAAATRG